ncbi:MAG: winged helix-turn-helix domain-containing protein [Dokdonella sp.]|nr:winged helix-turn-helix domain-containing protein [Dokdonella sp.]
MTLPVAIRDTDVMSSRVYQFCGFELNAATRELRYPDGRTLVLPVRVFDCVSHLIEHRDRAVGRDELIVVVWNRSDIKDNMLAQLVTRTRRLLEDTGEVQRIIRTVTGYGYHWIARTAVCAPSDAADTSIARTSSDAEKAGLAAAVATPQSRSSTLGRTARTVAVVCAIGLLAFGGWRSMTGPSEARVAARAPLPAQTLPTLVLPAVVTPVGSQEWLRIGVMAMVAERLQLAGQAVIKPESSVALTQGADVAAMRESDFFSSGRSGVGQCRCAGARERSRERLAGQAGAGPRRRRHAACGRRRRVAPDRCGESGDGPASRRTGFSRVSGILRRRPAADADDEASAGCADRRSNGCRSRTLDPGQGHVSRIIRMGVPARANRGHGGRSRLGRGVSGVRPVRDLGSRRSGRGGSREESARDRLLQKR